MHLSIVAAGSRGDVEPYLALGLGLQKAGFEVQICTDPLFERFVASTGLAFAPVAAAPVDMMQQNLSRQGGPLKLALWLKRHFNPLARQFFRDLEAATRATDAILYSTLAFAGYHVAEKQHIPSIAAYNVPTSPTHEFQNPSAPVPPDWLPFKRAYNWWSFRLFNRLFITLVRTIVNECRQTILGLSPLPRGFYRNLDTSHIPIIYGFSPNLLPPPSDWGEWLQVTGHWFLQSPADWQPPDDLLRFLEGGKPPVYVGFGSMVDEQIKRLTPLVLQALHTTGQRGILLGGWGGLGKGELPESVFCVQSVPHSWLFPRVAAVVHHGGSGTTANGLRYARPTVVVPFFADQPFWGERVYRLGAGPRPIPLAKLSSKSLAQAIGCVVNDLSMGDKAMALGHKLNEEDGVNKAVSLIKQRLGVIDS